MRLLSVLLCLLALASACRANAPSRARSQGSFGSSSRPSTIGSDISISAVSVLLPQDPNVRYRLDVFNGCFRWSVMNTDVIDLVIEPEDQECGRRVFVKPSQRYSKDSALGSRTQERERTWVTAEDKATQRLIRAEIFTDRIARFEVLTTNRELRKDDIEVIGIQAYDTEGNAFSTLDGLEFVWTVQEETSHGRDASNLLQLLPLKDSHVEASSLVLEMEAKGKQSSFVLAQAKATGKVVVSARLLDTAAAVSPSHPSSGEPSSTSPSVSQSVVLSILEPLNLVPSTKIFLPPYATVQYILQTIERDSFQNITMPKDDYVWSTSNPAIATVDSAGVVSAQAVLGETSVDVRFTAVDDNYARGQVWVVEPHSLDLLLDPSNFAIDPSPIRAAFTYIIENEPYHLSPSLYDDVGHKLYSTSNVQFEINVDEDFLRVDTRSSNDGSLMVLPKKIGHTKIKANVKSIGRSRSEQWPLGKRDLNHEESVMIVPQLRVVPSYPRISLPYHPVYRHTLFIKASGGSGHYAWTTSNRTVSTVTANGTLTGFAPGNDILRCVDQNLAYNRVEIPITVAVPTAINFVKGARETQIDSPLILGIHLTGTGPDGSPVTFDNCSALHMSANLSSQEVFGLPTSVACPEDLVSLGACACIQLQALRIGQATITLFFDTFDPSNGKFSEHGGEKRRVQTPTETTISAFKPVSVSPPQVLLTHSASLDIVISGGPNTWQPDTPVVPQFGIPEKDKLSIVPISTSTPGLWKYRLTCLGYGEQFVRISVGNPASAANPEPVFHHQSLKYACLEPRSLVLHPHNRAFVRPGGEGAQDLVVAHLSARPIICGDDPFFLKFDEQNATFPSDLISSHYKLRIGSAPLFNLTVLDEKGRRFDNFSSLSVEWSFSNQEYLPSSSSSSLLDFAPALPGQDYKRDRTIMVADSEGTATIQVAITGWDDRVLRPSSGLFSSTVSLPSLPIEKLSRKYQVSVVKNGQLTPPVLSLYHHAENKVTLKSIGGSGDANIRSNGTRIVVASVEPGSSGIIVQPLKMGVARITAVDTCLVGSQPTHSIVRVSDVVAIRVIAASILQLGSSMQVHFEMLDSAGHAFDTDQLKRMDIKLHLEGDAISVGDLADTLSGAYGASSSSGDLHDTSSGTSTSTPSSDGSSSGAQQQLKSAKSKRIQTIAQILAEDKTSINLIGTQLGVSTISIMMTNSVTGILVSSTPVQIQVFPPLEVYPKRLELLPGASFQLEVSGGPPTRSHLSFASSNHSLATVGSDGVIFTKNLQGFGSITVTAHVPGSSREDTFVETVELVVKQLHGILIHSSTTRLMVGEQIVVRVIGLDNESPFIWSGTDLAFQWEAVNSDILGLSAIYSAAGISVEDEQGQAVIVKALAPGTTRLSARLVAGPSYLGGKSASLAFEVVPRLSLAEHRSSVVARATSVGSAPVASSPCISFPTFYQRLLLAPHTRHSVRPNLDFQTVMVTLLTAAPSPATSTSGATIQTDSTVQLDIGADLVTSLGVAGTSILQLQDKRDGQLLLVQVSVKPIHHIELRARTPITWEMPVGAHFDFDVVLRDNLGHEFDSYEHTQFVWHFSRHDVVHAELLPSPESQYRKMLRIKGVRPGATMVQMMVKPATPNAPVLFSSLMSSASSSSRAASSQQHAYQLHTPTSLQHFHMIRVSNAILPLAPVVHVGGTIHFNISLSAQTSPSTLSTTSSSTHASQPLQQQPLAARAAWSSTQPRVIHVDPATGVATALSSGKATIHYNTTVFTSTLVRSVEVATVEMDIKSCRSLSNVETLTTSCNVPLTFRDMEGRELADTESVHHHIQASCGSDQPSFITATLIPSSESSSGRPECQYTASKSDDAENSVVSKITLTASAFDLKQSYKTTNQAPVSFTPAFVIKGGKNFRLTPQSPTTEFVVFSNEKLIARSRDTGRVTVDLVRGGDSGFPLDSDEQASKSAWVYQISVPSKAYPFSVSYVDFTNNATHQTEFIGVSYAPFDDGGLVELSDDSFFSFWTAVGLGSLAFGLAYIVSVICRDSS